MSARCLTIREACRNRVTLSGTDAQALEGALSQAEIDVEELRHEVARRGEHFHQIAVKLNKLRVAIDTALGQTVYPCPADAEPYLKTIRDTLLEGIKNAEGLKP
jgi:hypothetical protein